MKRVFSRKSGREIYGPKWQNTESSSDSESDEYDDLPSSSAPAKSTVTAQLSGIEEVAKQESPTTTPHVDNQNQIPKGEGVGRSIGLDGELMYRAALNGDWLAAEILLERDPNLALDYVTEDGDRALHVAAAMKKKEFVGKLVERMSENDLASLDGRGYTACCYAAVSGEVEIARVMIEKKPNLLIMHDENNVTPLRKAALRGNKDILLYFLDHYQVEDLSKEEWFDLLLVTIRSQMYDVAIEIVEKNGYVATMSNHEGTALHLVARREISNDWAPLALELFFDRAWKTSGILGTLFLRDVKDPPYCWKLAKKLLAEMQKLEKASVVVELIRTPCSIVHDAAKVGNVDLVKLLTRAYPQLIWDTDSNGYTLFHISVICRHIEMLDFTHEAMMGFTTISPDKNGDNILHLAAKSAPLDNTKLPPSILMRREFKWFKIVEQIVPRSCVIMENNDGLTPRDLFFKEHRKLLRKGEMWTRNMADSCMLIATILFSVVFSAAFTVPGGYGGQTGEPILGKKQWFKAFIVFEILGLIGSVVSIIMFRSIMASRFTEYDFVVSLPVKQVLGYQGLLMSLAGAFSAFMSSIILVNLNMNWLVWFCFGISYMCVSFWIVEDVFKVNLDIE